MFEHKIKIIVLDINIRSFNYENYSSLEPGIGKATTLDETDNNFTAKEKQSKLGLIVKRIHAICKKMQETHPDSMWIVVWREYGVFSKGNGQRESEIIPVSSSFKKQMKKKFLELTKQYANLVIIAGTISVIKRYSIKENLSSFQKKLKQIENYYNELTWLMEEEFVKEKSREILKNKKRIQIFSKTPNLFYFEYGHTIKTSCYVFQGEGIIRHDKVSPYQEFDEKKFPSTLFQPGTNQTNKGRNTASPFIVLIHPITKQKITIVVEICREHILNWANFALSQKFLPHTAPPPYLQFILSDSTDLMLKNTCAKFVVHVDSFINTNLITTNKFSRAENIELYSNDLLKDDKKLTLLQPIYPFEWKIHDLLLEIRETCQENSKLLKEFESHYAKFETLGDKTDADNNELYDFLSELSGWLEQKQWEYLITASPTSFLKNPFRLFSQEIKSKKTEEIKQYGHDTNDIHSRSHFALTEINGKLMFSTLTMT